MPRNYRKKTTRRRASFSGGQVSLVLLGIILGLVAAIIFYSNFSSLLNNKQTESNSVSKKTTVHAASDHHLKKHSTVSEHTASEKTTVASSPEFDFYTVLPKMQVEPKKAAIQRIAPTAPPPPILASKALSSAPTAPLTTQATLSTAKLKALEADILEISPTVPDHKTAAVVVAPSKSSSKPIPASEPQPIPNSPQPTYIPDSHYLLQLASLQDIADVNRLKSELVSLGLTVSIQTRIVNKSLYYRVLMGPYASRQIALAQQAKLQKKHISSILIKSP